MIEVQWMYVAYAIPVFLIIIMFYFKNKKVIFSGFSGFIAWLRPSFETNGHASPEKLTAFAVTAFTYIPSRNIYTLQHQDAWYSLVGSIVDTVFVLVLYKILTPKNIAEIKNGISIYKPNSPVDEIK